MLEIILFIYNDLSSHDFTIIIIFFNYSDTDTFEYEEIHALESVGKDVSMFEWHHFNLLHKDMVKFNLRTINGALNDQNVTSSGVLIDLTPPLLDQLGDGPTFGTDIEFQVSNYNKRVKIWCFIYYT